MDNQPKINKATLTPEQRDKLEQYQQAETQLQTLEDIAKMTQEIINIVDDSGNVDKIGTLLIDIRETLGGLRDKEAPETPDYAKPVVDAVSKLEKALSASIKGIDVKPQIKVDAPAVNVSPPSVDLKGVEKAVDKLSGSFKDAIKLIKIPENDDSALTEIMSNVLDQLSSIDTGVRTKPQTPNTIKVTNPDGSSIGSLAGSTYYQSFNDTTTDTNLVYLGKAVAGSDATDAAWQIKRYNKSAGTMTFADDITTFTKQWSGRTGYTY